MISKTTTAVMVALLVFGTGAGATMGSKWEAAQHDPAIQSALGNVSSVEAIEPVIEYRDKIVEKIVTVEVPVEKIVEVPVTVTEYVEVIETVEVPVNVGVTVEERDAAYEQGVERGGAMSNESFRTALSTPCPQEDSDNCYWNAATMGNGSGRSNVSVGGVVYFLD